MMTSVYNVSGGRLMLMLILPVFRRFSTVCVSDDVSYISDQERASSFTDNICSVVDFPP